MAHAHHNDDNTPFSIAILFSKPFPAASCCNNLEFWILNRYYLEEIFPTTETWNPLLKLVHVSATWNKAT